MMQSFRGIDMTAISVALRIVYAGMFVFTVLALCLLTRCHAHARTLIVVT